ncbi:acyl CoA:acetate/3-ketoacid CoA transferase [Paenibacillus sp. KN14-4R]|uniref:acyl CoA:acetate/3-ketoacid CoA transferase n=1 Tax=Paenibacillus sp. KN14-4R TaxID=3445773 RepID=UPI003FA00C73
MYGKMVQFLSTDEAVQIIEAGHTVAVSGFVGCAHPEGLTAALERRFLQEKMPLDLTLIYAAGQGDGKDRGLNHLAHEGLVRRVIGGHFGLAPQLGKLILDNRIEAYNLPQGVITHLFRDIAAGKPGTITSVGLHTFVDPRYEGGKLNARSTEDLVQLIQINGEEILFYPIFPVHVALLRGTTADEYGNITMEKEAATLEMLAMAQAVRNCGGKVIVQVERVAKGGSLDPKLVVIPSILVDVIVVSEPMDHWQTFAEVYNSAYSGETIEAVDRMKPMKLDERKIIARRAAQEIESGHVINLGIGLPEGIGCIAAEDGVHDFTLLVESGPIGGVPAQGLSFGAATNPYAILNQPSQFDFIDGGGIDVAFLGMAEADQFGDVNVSKYGSKLTGCGGFINISQNAKKIVFCSTFTAGGLQIDVSEGKLHIVQEGRHHKFTQQVEQITFNAKYALQRSIPVLYVTERAVFQLKDHHLELIEIAPGMELERDLFPYMSFRPRLSAHLKIMDEHLFR